MNHQDRGKVLVRTDEEAVPTFIQNLRYDAGQHVFLATLFNGEQARFEAELIMDERPKPGKNPSDDDFQEAERLIEISYLLSGPRRESRRTD